MITNALAALLNKALAVKGTITVPCPNGDALTVSKHVVLRWGRSKFADPSGRIIPSLDPGMTAVHHCGRGAVAKIAKEAM